MVDGGLYFWHFPLTIRRVSYILKLVWRQELSLGTGEA